MNESQMHDDLDQFLDELARGQQPDSMSGLAGFAHEIHAQHGMTSPAADQRREIWNDVMSRAASGAAPTTGGGGPLSQPALVHPALVNPWTRRSDGAPHTPTGWRGTTAKATTALAFITAMALLVATIAMFREGGRGSIAPDETNPNLVALPTQMMTASQGSSVTPMEATGTGDLAAPSTLPPGTEHGNTGNLAVPPTAEGTTAAGTGDLIVPGGASPELGDINWHAAIAPEECTPHPSATGEVTLPEPALAPFSTPAARDAEEVAMTMRQYQACIIAGQPTDEYVTDRFTTDIPETDEVLLARAMAGEEISAIYSRMDRSEFVLTIEAPEMTPAPVMIIREEPGVFQPHHAVQLADGRVAIPTTHRFPGWLSIDDFPALNGTIYVLAEVDGRWLIDQLLPFCIGDCDAFWDGSGIPGTPTPRTIGTPGTVIGSGEVALAPLPVDDSMWRECPAYDGPHTPSSDPGMGQTVNGAPGSGWGPAIPPTIPCDIAPVPEPPPGFEPIPMELPEA